MRDWSDWVAALLGVELLWIKAGDIMLLLFACRD
jgi:hypothetical protein